MIKLNFGCGTNRLKDWQNFDNEVDITRPLPFASDTADFILAEHVIEHVTHRQAVQFLLECRRILRVGGVARIIVPSVERVMIHADDDYVAFASRWIKGKHDVRGAMGAILWSHGHQTAWTESLLRTTLFYVGLEPKLASPSQSDHAELQNVDGHGRVIGERNNWIESSVFEGTRQGT